MTLAPAAAETIQSFLNDTNTKPSDYDLILTGDLGKVGSELLIDLLKKDFGIDISAVHNDCGLLIYDLENQDCYVSNHVLDEIITIIGQYEGSNLAYNTYLMIKDNFAKVLEFNVRFGDPETQVVLPLLESDLLTVMQACTNGTLADTEVKFAEQHACCVILASNGYPTSYKKGFEMSFTDEALASTFIAGAKLENGKLVTSGGRVTGTTAISDSLEEAIREAYRLSDGVKFEGAYRRSDIGQRALLAVK